MTGTVIFQFNRLRGGRTKGLRRRPFVNTGFAKTPVGTRPCGLRQTAVGKDQAFAVLQI